MNYISALKLIHKIIKPKLYFEIGCRLGDSLSISNSINIGVDPDFEIKRELVGPTKLYRCSSDYFFENFAKNCFSNEKISLAFIDGMHLAEYALRDFMNIEKFSNKNSIILVDDVLPREIKWTDRNRTTKEWTGDVYKLILILRKYRPDLAVKVFDIEMKGMAIISNLNSKSKVLEEKYLEIIEKLNYEKFKCSSIQELRSKLVPINTSYLERYLTHLKRGNFIYKLILNRLNKITPIFKPHGY